MSGIAWFELWNLKASHLQKAFIDTGAQAIQPAHFSEIELYFLLGLPFFQASKR